MKWFHKKRLQKLIDHLKTIREDKFNINYWLCGTQACAIGHACSISSFRKAGLHLKDTSCWEKPLYEPFYENGVGYAAASKFFGINPQESDYLFSPLKYNDNRLVVVITRLENFLKDKMNENS